MPLHARLDRRGRGRSRLIEASIFSRGHEDSPGLLLYGMDAIVRLKVSELLPDLTCTFAFYDSRLRPVCRFSSRVIGEEDRVGDTDYFTCEVPELALVPDDYVANLVLKCGSELEDRIDSAFKFRVEPGQLGGRPLDPTAQRFGLRPPPPLDRAVGHLTPRRLPPMDEMQPQRAAVEVLGPWLLNKGDELMLRAVVEWLGERATPVVSSDLKADGVAGLPSMPRILWPVDADDVKHTVKRRSVAAGASMIKRSVVMPLMSDRSLAGRGLVRGRNVVAGV